MSIQFFEIEIPVLVRGEEIAPEHCVMSVRITMGPDATAKDAVDELARKLERVCDTVDTLCDNA